MLVVQVLSAQNKNSNTDSLKDSVDFLIPLAEGTLKLSPEDARAMAEKARAYAIQCKYANGHARAALLLGKIYNSLAESSASLDSYGEAEMIFSSLADDRNRGLAHNGMGNVYLSKLKNYNASILHYQKAAGLLKNDSALLIRTLNNIGTIYNRTHRYDEAMVMYKKVYTIATRSHDLAMMSASLNNIGSVYDHRKDFKSAIPYYLKSIEAKESLNDTEGIVNALNNLATAYAETKNKRGFESSINKALTLSTQYRYHDLTIISFIIRSQEYEASRKFNIAKKDAIHALTISSLQRITFHNDRIYKQLGSIYSKTGQLDSALFYQRKYSALIDSLSLQEHHTILESMDEKNAFRSDLQPNVYKTQLYFLVVVVITGFLTYLLIQKRKSRNKTLTIHTAENILTKIAEPDVLLHIEVLNGQGLKIIDLNAVRWFQKQNRSYFVHTETSHYRLKKSMTELERSLPKDKFFRINRSVIINTSYIHNYSFWENHKYIIRMENADLTAFTISRSRLRHLKLEYPIYEKGIYS